MKRRVEQLPRHISREWAASSIRPFFTGAEADDEQFGIQGAEGRHGQCVPVGVTLANGREVRSQARAGSALFWVLK